MGIKGRALLLAMFALTSFLLSFHAWAPLAGAQSYEITFIPDRESFVMDLTANRSGDHVIVFTGNVTIATDFSTTVYISAQAGDWSTTITPTDKYVLAGENVIYYSGMCQVPGDAPDGGRNLIIMAQGEDPAGTPFFERESLPIEVVQNRVAFSPGALEVELTGGERNHSFNIQVTNRGTTDDTFDIDVALSNTLTAQGYRATVQYPNLNLASGEERTVNIQLASSENVTSGIYSYEVTVTSTKDPQSTVTTDYRLEVRVPVSVPVTPWLTYIALAVGLGLVIGLSIYIGATEVGLFAAYALFVVPLYVRLKKEQILSHFTRGQIYGYIQANPGASYSDILGNLGLSNGVLTYHLTVLMREGYVKAMKDILNKRFYPAGHKVPEHRFRPSRLQRDIIDAIQRYPGVNQVDLAKLLDESKQVINYHMKVLEREGIVELRHVGRSSRCYINTEGRGATAAVEVISAGASPLDD